MEPDDTKNTPTESNDLNMAQRAFEPTTNDRQLKAAQNISRNQVERVYDGNSRYDTPQTTPVPVSGTASIKEPTLNQNDVILNKAKPVINPIKKDPNDHKRPIGAVEYKPDNESRAQTKRQTNNLNSQGEQWKKYHEAWQNYYQKYYEGYYTAAMQNMKQPKGDTETVDEPLSDEDKKAKALYDLRKNISDKAKERTHRFRRSKHFFPIMSAVVVILAFLFLQYNRMLIANVQAYVSPGNADPQQTIYSPNASVQVSKDPKLIIPKINVDVPVVYDVSNDQQSQMDAMTKGVAHFSIPGANSVPGQIGNTVLSGHSSNDLFDSGNYKFIFAQLDKLENGDIIYANYNGTRYTYNVTGKQVVLPTDVSALVYETNKPILTLITCTPLGTSEKRLLVTAEQVSPDPVSAQPKNDESSKNDEASKMPSNSLTFFERLFTWNWN